MCEKHLNWRNIVFQKGRHLFGHSLTKYSGVMATSQYVAVALNLLTTLVAARMLGPRDYGLVALATAYPTLVWSVVGIKTVSITIRYISQFKAHEEFDRLLGIVKLGYVLDFFVSVVCFLFVVASSWWVSSRFYSKQEVSWMMIVFAFSFPFYSFFGSSRAVLSAFEKFNVLSLFNVASSALKLLLVVCFLKLGYGASGMVAAISLTQIIVGTSAMFVATAWLIKQGVGHWWKSSLVNIEFIRRELTELFGWNYVFIFLNGLVGQVPLMLLGRMRGSEEAGYYRLALNIAAVGSYPEGALSNVAYPILSARLADRGHKAVVQMLRQWTRKGGVPASLVPLLAIPLLPWAVPFMFGSAYQPALAGIQIMMIKAIIGSLFFWVYAYYYATGRVRLWTKTFAIYAFLMVSVGWLGIKFYGFMGLIWVNVCLSIIFKVVLAGAAFRLKPVGALAQ